MGSDLTPNTTDMSTSNGEDSARDATDELPSISEPPSDDNDDGEQKTMSTMKDRAQNDPDLECCICLENLSKDPTKFVRFTCCGQGMHNYCANDLTSMKMGGSCPMCRAKTPYTDEEHIKYLRPWVKKKKAWAQTFMAQMYRDGTGVKQSYAMAKRLYKQAAQQGDATAMAHLGDMYYNSWGVEVSYERAFEYYEQAAHLGDAKAQYNLGVMYEKGDGVEQSYEKAKEYYDKLHIQEIPLHNAIWETCMLRVMVLWQIFSKQENGGLNQLHKGTRVHQKISK